MTRYMIAALALAGAAAVAVPAAAQSWTGGYAGGQVAYGGGDADYHGTADGFPFGFGSISIDGFEGGLYGGVNYRIDNFVVGAEADANLGDISGTGTMAGIDWCGAGNCGGNNSVDEFWHFKIKSSFSLRARAGLLVSNGMLAFATGGLAIARGEWSNPVGVADDTFDPALGTKLDFTETHLGFVIGGGVEAELAPNIHVKGEMLYTDYGRKQYASSGFGDDHKIDLSIVTGRIGVSYNF